MDTFWLDYLCTKQMKKKKIICIDEAKLEVIYKRYKNTYIKFFNHWAKLPD